MKRKVALAVVVSLVALIAGGVWWSLREEVADLPRIPLKGGGEFRVVKIAYGTAEAHRFGGAPRAVLWVWDRLPNAMRDRLPVPSGGEVLVPINGRKALSIYWGWIDPATGTATLGPSGNVIMTTDPGEQRDTDWPSPFEYKREGYRQIYVDEPPRDSRRLHFRVPVEDETVEFTIENPAFGK